jgi:hypothetical protein
LAKDNLDADTVGATGVVEDRPTGVLTSALELPLPFLFSFSCCIHSYIASVHHAQSAYEKWTFLTVCYQDVCVCHTTKT